MNLQPGDILRGHYQITEQLGRGFYGQTYLAQDLHLPGKPRCVVKQLQPALNSQLVRQQAEDYFEQEANVLQILGIHNQIPQLLAHFEENQEFYLVQEFINGQDLSKELKDRKRFNENQVICLLEDVLAVLMHVHQQGVIHRDIKPSNLIRRQDGKICLIDFGAVKEIVALSVNDQGQTILTKPIGTPGYVSPEQEKGKPNFNSDIYSLGVTAIEALIGKIPEKDSRTDEFIWHTGLQINPKLKAILTKMVLKNTTNRYQSALEVYSELQTLRNYSTTRVNHFPRLFPLLGVGVVVVALLVILIPRIFVAKGDQVFNEANELFNSGQYEKAAEAFDKVLELNPNDYEALIRQGNAYIKLKEYTKSLNACEKAIQIKQNEAYAWNCKALALQNSQQYEAALAAHNTAIQLNAKSAVFWNNRGDTRLKSKQYDKAIADFDNAILLDDKSDKDKSSVYLYNRGKALYESGKYLEAIASFDDAINLNQNYHYAWTGRGNALRLSEQYEKSVAAYDRAIQIAPKDYESWYSKCLSLEKLDKIDEAIESCNQAIQIEPKNPAAIDAKQRLEKKQGR
ncbi:MAG TPA: serine/threonine protein kinase [Cyanobacteria bacterium UBA11369]|nr:serine/threonine protein kinase [Cyanobacteria bacterium UBA11371]HBE34704.1 serine/threonine protein kinase [Cyanobacteria bacterium UBA11368]HBE53763.1 serine/threonine protein kinase [Cyanobacteria bacterium UBA11369]